MNTGQAIPTAADLETRLAAEEEALAVAERELGAAALDSPNPSAATRRLTEARAAVHTTRAALAEVGRREQAQTEHETVAAAAVERRRIHGWIADYLDCAEQVIRCQVALDAAETQLAAKLEDVPNRLLRHMKGLDRRLDEEVTEFDVAAARYVPHGSKGRWPARTAAELRGLSVDACRERAAHAREAADQSP